MVDLALEREVISRWDRDFYISIMAKRVLTEKQLYHKTRINKLILDANKLGLLSPSKEVSKAQQLKIKARPDWDKRARRINYRGTNLTIGIQRRGLSQCKYIVRLDLGQWPSDDDLLALCDGTVPPERRHFSGLVKNLDKGLKYVVVYTD
jgi:hypothetical protein